MTYTTIQAERISKMTCDEIRNPNNFAIANAITAQRAPDAHIFMNILQQKIKACNIVLPVCNTPCSSLINFGVRQTSVCQCRK